MKFFEKIIAIINAIFSLDVFTPFREEGVESPFSSKRIAATLLVVASLVIGFRLVDIVERIATTPGVVFNIWLSVSLLGAIALFLVFAIILWFFATKKDIDDTIKYAVEILKNGKAGE